MTNAEAKNLEAISKAIDQHNSNCPFPASEVRMNPFEVERLGWEEIRGLPIVPDPELGTGAFRIICSRDQEGEGIEEAEALGIPIEVAVPERPDGEASGLAATRPLHFGAEGEARSDLCGAGRLWSRFDGEACGRDLMAKPSNELTGTAHTTSLAPAG